MKMFVFKCRDLGVDCDHVIKGETREEVLEKAKEHFKTVHPKEAEEAMKKMTSEEMDKMIMDAIKEE